MQPLNYKLSKCEFTILENNNICLEIPQKQLIFIILKDGKIEIKEILKNKSKIYLVHELPSKFHKFYTYAKKIYYLLKVKTPKVILKNDCGEFKLMKNEPKPDFEAVFKGPLIGFKMILTNEHKTINLWEPNGKMIEITKKDMKNYKQYELIIKKGMLYYKFCVEKL